MTSKEWLTGLSHSDSKIVCGVLVALAHRWDIPFDPVALLDKCTYIYGGSFEMAILDAVRNNFDL